MVYFQESTSKIFLIFVVNPSLPPAFQSQRISFWNFLGCRYFKATGKKSRVSTICKGLPRAQKIAKHIGFRAVAVPCPRGLKGTLSKYMHLRSSRASGKHCTWEPKGIYATLGNDMMGMGLDKTM
jgi:hypothetical protein